MVNTLCCNFRHNISAQSINTTNYKSIVGTNQIGITTEALVNVNARGAGTFSKLHAYVTANSLTTAATTIRFRKNLANVNQTFSISAGATGHFEDSSNTDTTVSGDDVCYSVNVANSGSGSITVPSISCLFSASSNTMSFLMANAATTGVSHTTASTTRFYPITGELGGNSTTAEISVQYEVRIAGTLKFFEVSINTNARTTTTTFRTRKNAANGTQTVAFGSGVTGHLEDTTNSDSVAVNDKINFSHTTSTGTQSISIQFIKVGYETTDTHSLLCVGNVTQTNYNTSTTRYEPLTSFLSGTATAYTANETKIYSDSIIKNLGINVIGNSFSDSSTLTLLKNNSDTLLQLTLAPSATGWFENTTNTVAAIIGDTAAYKIVTGTTAAQILSTCIISVNTIPGSSVTATKTQKFNIEQQITATNTLKFDVEVEVTTTPITATKTFKFDILTSVTSTKTQKFHVESQVTDTNILKFNVESQVTDTNTLKFNIDSKTTSTKTQKFDVLQSITSTKTLKFHVESKVIDTNTLKFDVLTSITTTKTLKFHVEAKTPDIIKTFKFDVNTLISTTKSHKFDILSSTIVIKTHKFNLLQQITQSKTHKYDLSTPTTEVTSTKTIKFDVLTSITATKTQKFDVLSTVTDTNTLKFNIDSQLTATKTQKFDILQIITQSKTHIYNINLAVEQVTTTKTHLYNVIGKVLLSKTHKFNLLSQVVKSKTHIYNLVNSIAKTKTHIFNVIARIALSATHKYSIIQKLTKTKTHLYNLEGYLIVPKIHKFNVIQKIQVVKTHWFTVLVKIPTVVKTYKYSILSLATKTKTHKYNIIGRLTTSKTHRWNAGGKVTTTKRHIYDLGFAFELPEGGGTATVARIKFPPKVRIIDIIADIRNLALADIELVPLQKIMCIGVVEIAETPFIKTASIGYKPRHRIASSLLVPPIIETIENRAYSGRIGFQTIEPRPDTRVALSSNISIYEKSPKILVSSLTQIKQEFKKVINLVSKTQLTNLTHIAIIAKLELGFLNNISLVAPEIMQKQEEQNLRIVLEILRNDDFFK